jgi:short-subunit dehydrogenase
VASEKKPGTALITGASGGIGLELAHVFAENGHDLVLVARSAQALETLAAELRATHGIRTRALPADLRRPDAPAAIESALADETIDVLVNNAGFGLLGAFAGTDLARERDMIQVNVTSLVDLTKRFLYPMVQRRRGRIDGRLPAGAADVRLLRVESVRAALQRGAGQRAGGHRCDRDGALSRTDNDRLPGRGGNGPRAPAARADVDGRGECGAHRGLMEGRRIVIPGLLNALLAQSIRFTPRRLATAIVKRLQLERTAS